VSISNEPNKELLAELQNLQAEFVNAFNLIKECDEREKIYLNHQALISNIGSSTRIENAVLTDSEIDWIDTQLKGDGKTTAFDEKKSFILDKLSKDRERSIEEVLGCKEVLEIIYEQSQELYPLTETAISGLHHKLLMHYPKAEYYAGRYKNMENKVISRNHETGEERTVLEPATPGTVTETAMQELVRWYNLSIKEYPWTILLSTEFVFRFLAIHPFQDGNGRLGRSLFLLSLLQSPNKYLSEIVAYISVDRQIEKNKSQYYKVLQKASEGKFHQDPKNYDLDSLHWFFIKVIKSAIKDIYFYKAKYQKLEKLSRSAVMVLNSFKSSPEKKLKVADIERDIELPRRTIQRSLKTLSDQEFIHRLGAGSDTRYQLVF
jgi:Fic family protein